MAVMKSMTNDQKLPKILHSPRLSTWVCKKFFEEVKKLSRSEARRLKVKSNQERKFNFFTTYNSSLPNMDTLVKKYLPLLHIDENLKEIFPASAFNIT